MPKTPRRVPALTDAELRVMNVLWERGGATVNNVRDLVGHDVPYTSVLTLMRTLEHKGYVRVAGSEGRKFVYEPIVQRQTAVANLLFQFIQRFFSGSPSMLTANLIETQRLSEAEKKRMRALLADLADDD